MLIVILIFILDICSYIKFCIEFGTLLFIQKGEVLGELFQPMAFEMLDQVGRGPRVLEKEM